MKPPLKTDFTWLCLAEMELSRLDFIKYQTILNFKHQINNVPPKHILSESAKISNKRLHDLCKREQLTDGA
jgi:hypothetical protein